MSKTHIARLTAIVGKANCLTDPSEMSAFTTDCRKLYVGRAMAVLRPGDTRRVSEVMGYCYEHGIAVVPQGGNTSLPGGAVPAGDEATTGSCIVVQRLFPLRIGSEGSCQIGGNLATNAGGTAVLRYGNMRDLMLGLEVVLPDGEVWNGLRALRKDRQTLLDLDRRHCVHRVVSLRQYEAMGSAVRRSAEGAHQRACSETF